MGIDFLKRTSKSFVKGWDRGRSSLAKPDLFARDPDLSERRYLAKPSGSARLCSGMMLVGDLDGTTVRARSGSSVAANIENLPIAVINRLRNEGAGCALVTVHAVHDLSGVAEVSIC